MRWYSRMISRRVILRDLRSGIAFDALPEGVMPEAIGAVPHLAGADVVHPIAPAPAELQMMLPADGLSPGMLRARRARACQRLGDVVWDAGLRLVWGRPVPR